MGDVTITIDLAQDDKSVTAADSMTIVVGIDAHDNTTEASAIGSFVYADGATDSIVTVSLAEDVTLDEAQCNSGGGAIQVAGFSGVAIEAIIGGQPIALSGSGLRLASAIVGDISGFARNSGYAGAVVQYVPDAALTIADWTAATGTPFLSPGKIYFLSATPGRISLAPPQGDVYVVPVGRALGDMTLEIEIGQALKILGD